MMLISVSTVIPQCTIAWSGIWTSNRDTATFVDIVIVAGNKSIDNSYSGCKSATIVEIDLGLKPSWAKQVLCKYVYATFCMGWKTGTN